MTDMYHENGTEVRTPNGEVGRISVTRRERKLIAEGKITTVVVWFKGKPSKRYLIEEVEPVPYVDPKEDQKRAKIREAIDDLDTNEGVKDVLHAIVGLIE